MTAGDGMISRRGFVAGTVASLCGPAAALAQSAVPRKPRVGVLWHAANIEEETPYYQSLLEGFRQLGYVDERTIALEHRFPDEKPELFARMAAELVALKPDVLVAVGSAVPYMKHATSRPVSGCASCSRPAPSSPTEPTSG